MKPLRSIQKNNDGFSLIEVIITLVVGAIIGVMFLSYMGVGLSGSGDPVNIARDEALAEQCMELIISDFVKEMNSAINFANALNTIKNRDYTLSPYNMPGTVNLTRTYSTYDSAGNEIISGSVSTNLKVTIKTAGHPISIILTAERSTNGDPMVFY